MSRPRTFWNFEPTPCRKVRIIVGPCLRETYWHNGLEGTEREAVEVNYHGNIFYLDNEKTDFQPAGQGWAKVTRGRGGPNWGHAEIPVARIVGEQTPSALSAGAAENEAETGA